MQSFARHAQRGFTLIELMVVATIIIVLAVLGIQEFSGFRAKGRDAVRITDLERIGFAIDKYYEICREYPATLSVSADNGCPSGTTLDTFIPSIPVDPLGASYTYGTSGSGNGYGVYVVRTTLEMNHTVLVDDIDGSTYDGVSLACDDSPELYYCIGS